MGDIKESKTLKEKWKPLGYTYGYKVEVNGFTEEEFEDLDEAVEYAKDSLADDDSMEINIIKVTYEIDNDGSLDETGEVEYIYDTDDLLESLKTKANKSLKESKLNEGGGAGYDFKGNIYDIYIDKINKIDVKDGKWATLDVVGNAKMYAIASSYEHSTEVDDINIEIKSIELNQNFLNYELPEESKFTDITTSDLNTILSPMQLDVQSKVIGGGFTHTTFDGNIIFDKVEGASSEIDDIKVKIENEDIIAYIDKGVQGENTITKYVIFANGDAYDEVFYDTKEEAIAKAKEVAKKDGIEYTEVGVIHGEPLDWYDDAEILWDDVVDEIEWRSDEIEESLKETKEDTIELTTDDILKLRKEITLNSAETIDYTNTLGVDPNWVANFFDGYLDYLVEIAEEENAVDFLDLDNEDTLKDWITIVAGADGGLVAPLVESCKECKEEVKAEEPKEEKVEESIKTEEVESETEEDTNTGIAGLLNTAIVDEWKTIDLYNSFIATFDDLAKAESLSEEKKAQLSNIINDILHEEMKHVGQLQTALEVVNQPIENIAKGAEEGKEQVAEVKTPVDEPKVEIEKEPTIIDVNEVDTLDEDLDSDSVDTLVNYFTEE